jgi:hypothetical protein
MSIEKLKFTYDNGQLVSLAVEVADEIITNTREYVLPKAINETIVRFLMESIDPGLDYNVIHYENTSNRVMIFFNSLSNYEETMVINLLPLYKQPIVNVYSTVLADYLKSLREQLIIYLQSCHTHYLTSSVDVKTITVNKLL